MIKNIVTVSLMAAVAVGLQALPSYATSKTGSGCTVYANTPYMASNAKATANSQMSCTFSGDRILTSYLVHVYTFFPNWDVAQVSDGGVKSNYNATVSTCDNGGSTTYQTRADFASLVTVVSSNAVFNHC